MTTNASLGLAGETVVILAGPVHPRIFVDVAQVAQGWQASFGFHVGNVSGLDTWRGPYGHRLAAITNGTCFGLDMLRARLRLPRGEGLDRTVREWLARVCAAQPGKLHQGELAL
jgi:hypothetical protein